MQNLIKRYLFGAGILSLFVLLGAGCFGGEEPSLSLSKTTFEPGEEIVVNFVALESYDSSAWVGIVPADVEHGDETVNDQYDIDYDYIDGATSGSMTFEAPNQPGDYDLRMHDNDVDGTEVTYVSFTVTAPEVEIEPSLTLEETVYAPGDTVTVTFTAPISYDTTAWVGIVPSDTEHGDETVNDEADLGFQYLSKQTEGTLTFTAPEDVGLYDLRMNDSDTDGTEVASVTFTVEVAEEEVEA
ncbi:MAG: hypothetical protein ABH846_01360 [Patescibacteria group bacterium]